MSKISEHQSRSSAAAICYHPQLLLNAPLLPNVIHHHLDKRCQVICFELHRRILSRSFAQKAFFRKNAAERCRVRTTVQTESANKSIKAFTIDIQTGWQATQSATRSTLRLAPRSRCYLLRSTFSALSFPILNTIFSARFFRRDLLPVLPDAFFSLPVFSVRSLISSPHCSSTC